MQKCLRLVFLAQFRIVYLLLGLYQIFFSLVFAQLLSKVILGAKLGINQGWWKESGVKIKFAAYATTKISKCPVLQHIPESLTVLPSQQS